VESSVVTRRRLAYLLPVVIFLILRALSHAHPTPLPWTSGVFDADGLDDILQNIRVAYAQAGDLRHVSPTLRAMPTGRVAAWEPSVVREALLVTAHSRAPPNP
jgi:hypothetical protein